MILTCSEGRFFNEDDQDRCRRRDVLGSDTADELFGGQSAVGQRGRGMAGWSFTVVGVLDKQKQAFGGGKNPQDNKAMFPITTFHQMHPETARLLDHAEVRRSKEQVRGGGRADGAAATAQRKVANEAPDNFAIFGTDSLTRLWDQITGRTVWADALALSSGGVCWSAASA